jgi:hypothetical protein
LKTVFSFFFLVKAPGRYFLRTRQERWEQNSIFSLSLSLYVQVVKSDVSSKASNDLVFGLQTRIPGMQGGPLRVRVCVSRGDASERYLSRLLPAVIDDKPPINSSHSKLLAAVILWYDAPQKKDKKKILWRYHQSL